VSRFIAEPASSNDIVGYFETTLGFWNQVFCRALKMPPHAEGQSNFESRDHWKRAVVTATVLLFGREGSETLQFV
jgi:hypothetical protein